MVGAEGEGERFPVRLIPQDTDSTLDFSVLFVEGAPGDRYGFVPLNVRAIEPNEILFMIHHPRGQPQKVSFDCQPYRQQVAGLLRHRCDTEGGSSGSLVFSENDGGIVGLHYATSFSDNTPVDFRFNLAKDILEVFRHSELLRSLQGLLPPMEARLRISSVPLGATIIYDGRVLGTTPTTLLFPGPGEWSVTLILQGYEDHVERLSVVAGEHEITAHLRAAASPPPISSPASALGPGQVNELIRQLQIGGTVSLTAGTFQLPTSLHLRNEVVIIGAGMDSTVIQTDSAGWLRDADGIPVRKAVLLFDSSGDSVVHGVTVQYTGTREGSDVIYVRSGTVTLREARVTGGFKGGSPFGDGITFAGSANGVVERSVVRNNDGDGIVVTGRARAIISQTIVERNTAGVFLADHSSGTLVDNTIDRNIRHGVFCGNSSTGRLDGNTITHNGWFGIGSHFSASCDDVMSRFSGNIRGDREEPW